MSDVSLLSAELDSWSFGRFIDEIGRRHAELPAMVSSDHSRTAGTLGRWKIGRAHV